MSQGRDGCGWKPNGSSQSVASCESTKHRVELCTDFGARHKWYEMLERKKAPTNSRNLFVLHMVGSGVQSQEKHEARRLWRPQGFPIYVDANGAHVGLVQKVFWADDPSERKIGVTNKEFRRLKENKIMMVPSDGFKRNAASHCAENEGCKKGKSGRKYERGARMQRHG